MIASCTRCGRGNACAQLAAMSSRRGNAFAGNYVRFCFVPPHSSSPDRATSAIAPTVEGEGAEDSAPQSGEVRFYKKAYSRPTHDVMVRVQDCGCSNWQGAHAAEKARKGIAKLERDRMDWKMLQHCASCTG